MSQLLIFGALLVICTGYALLHGGAPERIAAAIFLGGVVLTVPTLSPMIVRFRSLEVASLIVDAIMLSALLALALRADRFWTLWISGLQGAQVLSHALSLAGTIKMNLAYAILSQVYCFPMLGLLALGTFRHRQRLARYGVDSSWSRSSASARRPAPWSAPSG